MDVRHAWPASDASCISVGWNDRLSTSTAPHRPQLQRPLPQKPSLGCAIGAGNGIALKTTALLDVPLPERLLTAEVTRPGNPRRFDSIWISDHFTVEAIDYPYADSCAAGSDHSAVIADLALPVKH
jgi:hypothetical protein